MLISSSHQLAIIVAINLLYFQWAHKMKAIENSKSIIILWFLAFTILFFILTLKFQNYNIDVRATTSALLTTPFAIWALINIIKTNQFQTE